MREYWRYRIYVCVCVQVCAFAGETEADMRGKVVIRLQQITELEDVMRICMAGKQMACVRVCL